MLNDATDLFVFFLIHSFCAVCVHN